LDFENYFGEGGLISSAFLPPLPEVGGIFADPFLTNIVH
jgi:hypothetical protein